MGREEAFTPKSSILLLIDFQAKLMPAIENASAVLANAQRLGETARLLGVPVLATEQNPAGLGPVVPEIARLRQGALEKTCFDATREPAWPDFLPKGRPHVVAAGCEAHVCVLQTVAGMLGRGLRVRLVRDAAGSRAAGDRDAALHRAERCGAELVTTEMVIFEWLESCDHPRFREVLSLVKRRP